MSLSIALTGNPNSGKTTLFNRLTGTRQTTGNWPGVTVEKKTGFVLNSGEGILAVDLPGIYSLSPYSLEEVITRNYIVHDRPDVVVNVVDATNMERNLYLTLQLKKLGRPLVVALNMMDEVRSRGDHIDLAALSFQLGAPVVPVSAKREEGIRELVEMVRATADAVLASARATGQTNAAAVSNGAVDDAVDGAVDDAGLVAAGLVAAFDGETEMETAALYQQAADITAAVLVHGQAPGALSRSDRIDHILTNRFLALPIFLGTLFLVFQVTFHERLGGSLTVLLRGLFDGPVRGAAESLLNAAQAPEWIVSLLLDGVMAGVGGMLTFLPQIALLFLFLTILEDSGYMARAAFIVDRLFQKLGLSGRSFIPMLMGFGCTVPAIMAARTLENQRDRRLTIMITPFMSCGARMPVYALFAGAYFATNKGLVTFSMYLIGVAIAILGALVLGRTVLRGGEAAFVIELPPYRLPDARSLFLHVYDRVRDFVIRAGTIIFAMTMVIWVMQRFSFTLQRVSDSNASMIGQIGGLIAPLLRPLGFGNYQAATALLTGLIAKESVVSTFSVLYSPEAFAHAFTPLSAYAFMVFTLLYTPCIAAISALHREMNDIRWTIGAIAFQTGTAYVAALLVAQSGRLLHLLPYLLVILLGFAAISVFIRMFRRKGSVCTCESAASSESNARLHPGMETTVCMAAATPSGSSGPATRSKPLPAMPNTCGRSCAGCSGCPSWIKPVTRVGTAGVEPAPASAQHSDTVCLEPAPASAQHSETVCLEPAPASAPSDAACLETSNEAK